VPDPNIFTNSRIHPLEGGIIFSSTNTDPDLGFMHHIGRLYGVQLPKYLSCLLFE
jgi:hypothetical protein